MQGSWPCSVKVLLLQNPNGLRQIWQNLWRKIMAQKGLLCQWWWWWSPVHLAYAFFFCSVSLHFHHIRIKILSRVGCVTRLITSRCQGCSDYLLGFASTIMHFTIVIARSITITASTVSRPILDFTCILWRLGSDFTPQRLMQDWLG
jgi:hypothetical protein